MSNSPRAKFGALTKQRRLALYYIIHLHYITSCIIIQITITKNIGLLVLSSSHITKNLHQIAYLHFIYGIRALVREESFTMATIALNVRKFVTLQLNNNNYPLWCEQILALVKSQDLVEHLPSETPAPSEFESTIDGASGSSKPEPTITFRQGRKSDHLFQGWIIGTLSEEALSLVVGLDSAHQIWVTLKVAYAHDSQEREFHLTQQLT